MFPRKLLALLMYPCIKMAQRIFIEHHLWTSPSLIFRILFSNFFIACIIDWKIKKHFLTAIFMFIYHLIECKWFFSTSTNHTKNFPQINWKKLFNMKIFCLISFMSIWEIVVSSSVKFELSQICSFFWHELCM